MYCSHCGSTINPSWNYCPDCSQKINVNYNKSYDKTDYVSLTSNKNRSTAIKLCLLSLICLGGFHRIYVGKLSSGLFYLLLGIPPLTPLLWFISLYDLVQLLLGQFTDNVGQPLRR